MTTGADYRDSLAASRTAGLPFADAWTDATAANPLTDFMQGYFPGNDATAFEKWARDTWRAAYERLPFTNEQKPTRLEATGNVSNGLHKPHIAPQPPIRVCQGRGCPRKATHGRFGPRFCRRHLKALRKIIARPEHVSQLRADLLARNERLAA